MRISDWSSDVCSSDLVNFLSWASGFIYTDGKGDTKLWDDIYPIVRRFGRDDDLRILNYMTGNVKGGGQSNTTNPFTKGQADALKEMMTSLMDSAGGDTAMWKGRAIRTDESRVGQERVMPCESRR